MKNQIGDKKISRREFVGTAAASAIGIGLVGYSKAFAQQVSTEKIENKMIWGNLVHLSMNMWEDRVTPEREARYYRPYLRFDEKLWNDILVEMQKAKMTMVVIDLGDGVKYQSHPEIAVKNAWTVDKLKKELAKIRSMGMEPIPKLNFSTGHDAWMGEYSRCVSTPKYYDFCRNLIAEVIELFDKPRFFHLGMDEESPSHQKYYAFLAVRQFDLWWKDLYFYFDQVTKGGARPWLWSDYYWHHPETFLKKMPRSVVQSNWYYGTEFNTDINYVKAYHDLEEYGYDQIPTGSNFASPENFGMTVDYCKKHIGKERLLGFLQTPWRPTLETYRQHHLEAVRQVGRAIAKI
ncbi:Tat pathway signal protein [Planctomycetota bacterium]